MEEGTVKSKGSSQRDSQVRVVWRYTNEVSPSWRRLMRLLLERKDNRITRTIEEGKDA